MSNIEPLGNDRISGFLGRRKLGWLRTPGGAFIVDFRTDFGQARVYLGAEGDGDIFVVRVTTGDAFGAECWPALMSLVNRWNADWRFAKAYLAFVDDDRAMLVAEHQTPIGTGIHDELLDVIAGVAIDAGIQFHRHVAEELVEEDEDVDVPPPDEFEGWLDRSA